MSKHNTARGGLAPFHSYHGRVLLVLPYRVRSRTPGWKGWRGNFYGFYRCFECGHRRFGLFESRPIFYPKDAR